MDSERGTGLKVERAGLSDHKAIRALRQKIEGNRVNKGKESGCLEA